MYKVLTFIFVKKTHMFEAKQNGHWKNKPAAWACVQITEKNIYFEINELEFYKYDRKWCMR